MERNYITPNIDTYDAIIQAWIDTGSLDGLLRAEEWAKRAFISASEGSTVSTAPQLQTLRPIMAAWTYCGRDRGSGRVVSWRRYQVSIIEGAFQRGVSGEDESQLMKDAETVFSAARNCSTSLDEIISQSNFAGVLDSKACTPMFSTAVGAWGGAARLALLPTSTTSPLTTTDAVREMIQVVRLFDAKKDKAMKLAKSIGKVYDEHTINCI
ncbi:predicted protein [Thalassiosira pseudonana CCMP1335]|uniref:Uncharacterized protein n=1 Tax=Thalassiosira pseudonana TaxID=35128 RepID=B8CBT8_THAPS|nr:predicted protein [Thalassiosira pseudonana CCMP1335]EED89186.1 predicted protein [Thalassiosira pseudonana CCMP1335]